MKRKVVAAAVLAVVLGVGAAYYSGRGRTDGELQDILTPVMDSEAEFLAEDPRSMVITDEEVPLAPGPDTGEAEEHPYIGQVIDLVNEERARAGLAPLEKNDQLSAAASVRAAELVSSFSHTRPDGSAYRTVLDQSGIGYSNCGENVALGYRSPEDVMSGWMGSEGHRANILNERYDSIGVGYLRDSSGQAYWVQLFTLRKQ